MTNIIHGHSGYKNWSPEYNSWVGMKARCDNPNQKKYPDYGGRGISYCERWKDFQNFLKDMGYRPEGTCLERINNDGNYCLENCRWATYTEQNFNTRIRSDNTSGVKGVRWMKKIQRWIARGHLYGKEYHLYCGPSFEEACEAREAWEDIRLDMLK